MTNLQEALRTKVAVSSYRKSKVTALYMLTEAQALGSTIFLPDFVGLGPSTWFAL
jgi:hypothetical protein